MEPRRISVAFIDLEPESVVLAKDLEHHQLGLLQAEEHPSRDRPTADPVPGDADANFSTRSPSVQPEAEESDVDTGHGKPSLEEAPKRMETAAGTGRANQNQSQSVSEEIVTAYPPEGRGTERGDLSASQNAPSPNAVLMPQNGQDSGAADEYHLAVKNPKEPLRAHNTVNVGEKRLQSDITEPRKSTLENLRDASTNTQKVSLLRRAKRPRPKTPKSHPNTNVDWDEDQRPTDAELSEPNSEHEGTSVSSPTSGSPRTFQQNSGKKRKRASKSRATFNKRRRTPKGKKTISPDSAQLPLTSKSGLIAKAMTSDDPIGAHLKCATLTSGPLDAPPSDSGMADLPGTLKETLTFKAEEPRYTNLKDDDVIIISSCSPLSSVLSFSLCGDTDKSPLPIAPTGIVVSPGSVPNSKTADTHGQPERKHPGRGGKFGHKLTLALREAGVLSQSMAVDEDQVATDLSRVPADKTHSPKSPGYLLNQSLPAPSFTRNPQKAVSVAVEQNASQHAGAESSLVTKVASKNAIVEQADDLALRVSSGLETRSKSQTAMEVEIGRNAMPSQQPLSDLHRKLTSSPGEAALQPDQKNNANFTASQRSEDSFERASNVSSEGSSAAETDHLKILLVKGREAKSTPESQRPLLAAQGITDTDPSYSRRPKSIPRSSIVDPNGSPRLLSRRGSRLAGSTVAVDGASPHQRSSSDVETMDGSDSGSEATSNASSRMMTTFQRDICLEYGILNVGRTTPGSRKMPVWQARLDFRKTSFSSSSPSASMGRTSAEIKQGKAPEDLPSSSQRTVDVMGKGSDETALEQPEDGEPEPAASQAHHQPRRTTTQTKCDYGSMRWVSSLQAAQKLAHETLLETNQRLARQLEAERDAINNLLETCQEGFIRVLDELGQAHETRRELYRQQVVAVKVQHSQICQTLVRRLQELDKQVQQSSV